MSYFLTTNLRKLYEAIFNKLRYFNIEQPTEQQITESISPFVETVITGSPTIIKASDLNDNEVIVRSLNGSTPVFIGKPYIQRYVARITQEDVANPVLYQTLHNSTGRALSGMTRLDEGSYRLNYSGALASNIDKIEFVSKEIVNSLGGIEGKMVYVKDASTTSQLCFNVVDLNDEPADSLLTIQLIEINIYP